MKHVDGHVPLPLLNRNENCCRCSLWSPAQCQGKSFTSYHTVDGDKVTGFDFPCYEGTRKQCIYAVATPENVAKSVAWRLTR